MTDIDVRAFAGKTTGFLDELQVTNKKIQDFFDHTNTEELQRNFSAALGRFETLTATISDEKIPENVSLLISELRESNNKLKELVETSNIGQILTDMRETMAMVKGTLTKAGPAAQNTMEALHEGSIKFGKLVDTLKSEVVNGSGDFRTVLFSISDLTERLRALSENLNQNPSQLIFGTSPQPSFPQK